MMAQHFMSSVGISLKPRLTSYTDQYGNRTAFAGANIPIMGDVGVHLNAGGVRFGRLGDPRAANRSAKHNQAAVDADAGVSSKKPIPFSKGGKISQKGQTYDEIKARLISSGKLFEDPDFPATQYSIDYNQSGGQVMWKRPSEIVSNPQFVIGGTSRFDVQQGALGDCWLLAAVANLSLYQDLLDIVVPPDQSFDRDYCGLFKFHFWQFGEWVEVVVDDRLPCDRSGLLYMHSADKNEFWSALLEKAYAKLFGAYDALKGGSTIEALEDFTGGLAENFDLREKTPPNLSKLMLGAYKKRALMACSINADPHKTEAIKPNGLIMGHAYSITKITTVNLRAGQKVLVRVRNPWGNQYEWKGRWSDKSSEWNELSEQQRQELGLSFSDDGEFWMSFEDWCSEFEKLEMCCLGPQSLDSMDGKTNAGVFQMSIYNNAWVKGATAGGCRNFLDTFWLNPQFRVRVEDTDADDDDTGTLIVGLMQKNRRKMRKEGAQLLTIGFMIYALKDLTAKTLDMNFFKYNAAIGKSNAFINAREVTGRFEVPPGEYVIIPSTFQPNEEADFLLRIFSESTAPAEQMDDSIGMVEPDKSKDRACAAEDINPAQTEALKRAFDKVCGTDGVISADELIDILNVAFTKELNDAGMEVLDKDGLTNGSQPAKKTKAKSSKSRMLLCCTSPQDSAVEVAPMGAEPKKNFTFGGFTPDTCRSLIAMMDVDHSGTLDFDEFKELWAKLRGWKNSFKMFDADGSGSMSTFELRNAINKAGYTLDTETFKNLVMRFSSRDRVMHFDEFISCMSRLHTAFEIAMSKRAFEGTELLNIMIYL